MKANEAPEKIYIFEQDFQHKDHKVMYGVNQDKDIKGLIEYTRTDAFIEKAETYLKEQFAKDVSVLAGGVVDINFSVAINNFINYMKGE